MGVENTATRTAHEHVAGALVSDGTANYIEDMEAAGQRQLVGSDVLPTDGPWHELTELGAVRGEPVAGDPIFTHCTLPAGWAKAGSEHAMWSHVVDERGVKRVAVFYKAAFYDRSAHFHLVRPGADLAAAVVYAEGPVGVPPQWDVLTEAERGDYRDALAAYAAADSYTSSRTPVDRARQALAAVPA